MLKTKEKYRYLLSIAKFRVKIKSLTEESKIIKREKEKNKGNIYIDEYGYSYSISQNIHVHNKVVVGMEQRHTLLAYAFYRNVPYKKIENKCLDKPSVPKIKRILKSLTGTGDSDLILKWIEE